MFTLIRTRRLPSACRTACAMSVMSPGAYIPTSVCGSSQSMTSAPPYTADRASSAPKQLTRSLGMGSSARVPLGRGEWASSGLLGHGFAHTVGVRQKCQRRIGCAGRRHEGGIQDVESPDRVRLAVHIEDRRAGIGARAQGTMHVAVTGIGLVLRVIPA